MNSKNSDNQMATPVEVILEDEDLKAQLGIDELEERIAILEEQNQSLKQSLGEWLVYVNLLDRRIQALNGEPEITETIRYSDKPDGSISLQRYRPPIPSNLLEAKPSPVRVTKSKDIVNKS